MLSSQNSESETPPTSPPTKPLRILDLPQECLLHVLRRTNSNFQELQTLRKICSSFRTVIDLEPLTIFQTAIHLKFTRDSIIIGIDINGRTTDIEYQQTEDGCLIDRYWRDEHKSKYLTNQEMLYQWEECASQGKRRYHQAEQGLMIDWFGKRRRFLIDENILSIAYDDFESMLKHQNQAMFESLRFHFGEQDRQSFYFRKKLNSYLESRKKPLKVRKILFTVTSQAEVMSILPFMDLKSLEEIWIFDCRSQEDKDRELFQIDEIVETGQWKNAKVVRRDGSNIELTWIEHFLGKQKAAVHLHRVNLQLLLKLRDSFLNHPISTDFLLMFSFLDDTFQKPQFNIFGEHIEYQRDIYEWHFRKVPDDGQLLKVLLNHPKGEIKFYWVAFDSTQHFVINYVERILNVE